MWHPPRECIAATRRKALAKNNSAADKIRQEALVGPAISVGLRRRSSPSSIDSCQQNMGAAPGASDYFRTIFFKRLGEMSRSKCRVMIT